MAKADNSKGSKRSIKGYLLALVLLSILVWVVFFDSHSIVSRMRWSAELEELKKENAELSAQIEELRKQLEEPVSDERIEEIARTKYGMSREGEVIYKVEKEDD